MPASTPHLNQLRTLLRDKKLDAYFIPSEDAHSSEYIAPCDARRAFISGFTGSAGFAIVTLKEAALWTDGRYYLQASQQLDSNWTLMKAGLPDTPSKEEWLNKVLSPNSRVGVDPKLVSHEDAYKLGDGLEKGGHSLVAIDENLVDGIWAERPPFTTTEIFHLPLEYSGRPAAEKISTLRKKLKEGGYAGFIVSALDEAAWLFNLRGSDINFNPVFFAYALITEGDAILYLDEGKLTAEARLALRDIKLRPYNSIYDDLKDYAAKSVKLTAALSCNWALVKAAGPQNVSLKRSLIEEDKAIKNDRELKGLADCHIRDGAALTSFFAWLENELLNNPGQSYDEVDAADKLEQFRRKQRDFVGLSFDTISGAGPNGAIIHYRPEKPTASKVTANALYLCDSGAQYRDGTTDVTRTLHFGTPSQYEKECFTRVLLGNIALNRAVFPTGTTGFMLDPLARLPLWRVGLDYRHGTGHGVGHFLNVHEGPQGISFHIRSNNVPLKPGMTVTDEPGYYEDGKFGIRIENVLVVVKADTPNNFGQVEFLRFDNLTMVPIQKKLIDLSMLNGEEIGFLNAYHSEVMAKLGPLLRDDPLAYKYLERECEAIRL